MPFGSMRSILNLEGIRIVPSPIGFNWNAPIIVFKSNGKYKTDFDVSKYQITGKTYYVDVNNGNDSNDGLTLQTALKTISVALAKSDVDVILINGGLYQKGRGMTNGSVLTLTRPISMKALPGQTVIISFNDSATTFTKVSGKTYTYQGSRTGIGRIFDAKFKDSYGDYQELTKKTSIDEVEATPGSWFDDATYIYVHTSDSRVPDIDIRPYFRISPTISLNGFDLYMEGIEVQGGSSVIYSSYNSTPSSNFYAKNCIFKYSTVENICTLKGAYQYLQNCVAARGALDGFNYHANGAVIPKAIEVSCVGRHNGTLGDGADNGSTIHDGGTIIRINCECHHNHGPNFADSNDNTKSWNLGCIGHESVTIGTLTQQCDFQACNGVSTGAKIWLDGCKSYGSRYGIGANTVYDTVLVRNVKTSSPNTILGTKLTY